MAKFGTDLEHFRLPGVSWFIVRIIGFAWEMRVHCIRSIDFRSGDDERMGPKEEGTLCSWGVTELVHYHKERVVNNSPA